MRLRLAIPLLTLLLAACLHSDRPFINASDLVAPAGFEGRYWVFGSDGPDSGAGIVSFSRDAAGMVQADTDALVEHEESLPPRFVRLVDPDLYLMIGDTSEQASTYYLLRKEKNGVWRSFDLSISKQTPFLDERVGYLNSVVGRYGYSLDLGGDGAGIKGPVSNGKIPALFRDRDFLAALDADLEAVYLPLAGEAPPSAVHADEVEPEVISVAGAMVFTGTFANWQGAVQPQGLEGIYLDEYRGSGLAKGATQFKIRPDGRFDLIAVDLEAQPIVFVALQANSWLGIEEHNSIYEGKADRRYLFHILKREAYGWSWSDVSLERPWRVPELARERNRALKLGAARHGVGFDGYYLTGVTTPSGLIDLLRDGQFSLGLSFQGSLERAFYRQSEIDQRFTAPAKP